MAPLELQTLGNADEKALKIKTDLMKKITKNNETQARALMIMSRIYCILFFLKFHLDPFFFLVIVRGWRRLLKKHSKNSIFLQQSTSENVDDLSEFYSAFQEIKESKENEFKMNLLLETRPYSNMLPEEKLTFKTLFNNYGGK